MKKGLKRNCAAPSITGGVDTRPDEEGIETQRCAGTLLPSGVDTRPDEEGIETSSNDATLRHPAVSTRALMKKGLAAACVRIFSADNSVDRKELKKEFSLRWKLLKNVAFLRRARNYF